MKPWWERWPGRLEYEINKLRESGVRCELDKDALSYGIVKLDLLLVLSGEELNLFVVFPDIYPYTRFEIYAPDLNLEHHQNPFHKNLCMIGMSSVNWRFSDTVAEFLSSRLPKVIETGTSSDPSAVKNLEEQQAEPITYYYPYFPDTVVLVDSSWFIDPTLNGGIIELKVTHGKASGDQYILSAVKDRSRKIITGAEPELISLYSNQIEGKWIRCKNPIRENDPLLFYKHLVAQDKSLKPPKWQYINKKTVAIIGVLFPEEVAWRDSKDGWLFLLFKKGGKRTR